MTATETPTDGRRLRRDRNRESVVSALLELYREGDVAPSTEAIAARAGISARSLFRYFDDSDALVRTAIARQQEHLAPLYALDIDPAAPLDERIGAFVAGRVRLVEAMGAVGQVARNLAAKQPRIAGELGRVRAVLRGQVADVFAAELSVRSDADATATLAAIDVLTSWEAYHLLREDQGLSAAAAAAVITTGLRRLLGTVV
jgi:TetR/AcrR family transcriptional regulator of autoinduction and epiphytic fitness